ncbi:MAG: ATP-dependent acyl-CoA ligase [Desulfobacteraceae bacterium]|nr:ATP-dependent acyl-CoA ligase [Desulfobacteraceae bacterium]
MKEYAMSDWVLGRVLSDKAARLGDKPFLRTKDADVTYAEMNSQANRFAQGFLRLGLKHGDKVCLMLDNCLEHYYCWFGLNKIGSIDVPINTAYKGQILEYIINNSEAKVLVVDQIYLDRIQFVQEKLEHLEHVVVCRQTGAETAVVELNKMITELADFFSEPDRDPGIDVHYSDLASIVYTSGTTGPSKGVMMSQAHCYYFSWVVAENIGLKSIDVDYMCLPLFHVNARLMCSYACILAEAQVAMAPRFSLSAFWKDIQYFQATVFNGLGAIGPLLLSAQPSPEEENNPVRLAFLVPTPKDHKAFEQRFGLKVATTYGMTEIGLPIFSSLDKELPPGSCGKSIPSYEVKIVDEYDNELPPNQVGEFVVRNRIPYTLLSGYYNMPEKTLEDSRNLWFHTGDAMYVDSDGWFYFVDRLKDSIRRRGENISSFEVENVINQHPAVLECAVVAVKDEVMSEDEVKACVVLHEGQSLTLEGLIRFCEERMPYFHIPRYVEFLTELPKTDTGKVRKIVLRESGETQQTWDREEAGIKIKR